MKSAEWNKLLRKSRAFSSLNDEQVAHLLQVSEQAKFDENQIVLKEGDIDDEACVYLVGSGAVAITLSGVGDRQIPVYNMGPGDFFGEMAWLEQKPRTATVITTNECVLRKIPGASFQELMRANAMFASSIAMTMSERLRRVIEQVLAVKLKDFDEKLELTNTKLDASLKSVESQQKAAHTVFEEINTRANEVISSAERSRSRTTSVFTALGAVLAVLGFFFGKGIIDLKDVDTDVTAVQQRMEELKPTIESLDDLKHQSEALQAGLKQAAEGISETNSLQKFMFANAIRDTFESLINRTNVVDLLGGSGQAFDFYRRVLQVKDPSLTEELFKNIERHLLQKRQTEKIMNLLKAGLEKKGVIQTEKQQALSHYYLLAAYLLTDDERAFRQHTHDFDEFIRESDAVAFEKEFGPSWFEEVVLLRKDANAPDKIEKINAVWRRLAR